MLATGAVAVTAGVGARAARRLGRRGVAGRHHACRARSTEPARCHAGAQLDIKGITPYLIDNADFYRIDTALSPPDVPADSWTLRIHGLVDHEIELSFADLLERRLVERRVTLTCVSNEVGGELVGNATWLGVPLAELLDEAGVQDGADALLSTSADGFTVGTPIAAVTDGRDALLAIGMNGEPLPIEHGFPARMVVRRAVRVRVRDQVGHRHRGHPLRRLQCVLDRPRVVGGGADQDRLPHRRAAHRSSSCRRGGSRSPAWPGHRDEASTRSRCGSPGATGRSAGSATEDTVSTWRQWVYEWDAEPGDHELEVRATDGDGETQTEDQVPPRPDGATGWHQVSVTIE